MHPVEWAWTLDEEHSAAVLKRVREMDRIAPELSQISIDLAAWPS